MKYFKIFDNHADHETETRFIESDKPAITYYEETKDVKYVEWMPKAVKFSVIRGGTQSISMYKSRSYSSEDSYSYDGMNWTSWDGTEIPFGEGYGNGKDIYIRSQCTLSYKQEGQYNTFSFGNDDVKVKVSGIAHNLFKYKSSDIGSSPRVDDYQYYHMFSNCKALEDCSELALCSEGPTVNYTSLSGSFIRTHSFDSMFEGCSSLKYAPIIGIRENMTRSFYRMFKNCTSLESVTIRCRNGISGFEEMCYGCSNLNYIKVIASGSSVGDTNWVNGVSSTGTFVKKSGSTWKTGVNGIPMGWTVVEE